MSESAISVKNVKIQYRVMNKMSLLKAIMNPKRFPKPSILKRLRVFPLRLKRVKF